MILKTYIDTTQHQVLNIVILAGRLKTTMVLTLYALTKRSKSPIILTRKDKDKYKEGLQGQNVFVVQN